MSDRVNRLENEIQTLSRAVFKGEMPPPGAMQSMTGAGDTKTAAAMEVRISQLEGEIASLTGKLEQQSFDIRQFQERVEKELAALKMAAPAVDPSAQRRPLLQSDYDTEPDFKGPEGLSTDLPPQPASDDMTAADAPASPDTAVTGQLGSLAQSPDGDFSAAGNTPADLYEQAFARMRDKDYATAEKTFTVFLEKYPKHDLAANAKYWLGETHYVRGQFDRAARVFAEAYQLYPKGPKGPDNLLKLALSLNGMGKKDDACLAFTQLKREYPSGAAPVLARAEKEAANIGCK
ncbi:MAG TPA: tol-pal system protein YbgF [Alphaproteobacteria bacterium]